MLILPRGSYIRKSKRGDNYIIASRKRDKLADAGTDDMISRAGLRYEKPKAKLEKTANDVIQEFRSKGLHLLTDL